MRKTKKYNYKAQRNTMIKATHEAGPGNANKVRLRIGKLLPGLATVCKYNNQRNTVEKKKEIQ